MLEELPTEPVVDNDPIKDIREALPEGVTAVIDTEQNRLTFLVVEPKSDAFGMSPDQLRRLANEVERQIVAKGTPIDLPTNVAAERFSQAFANLANRLRFPAAWIAFAQTEKGMVNLCGGDPFAVQMMNHLMGNAPPPEGIQAVTRHQFACVQCGAPLMPGKAGRKCPTCLANAKPEGRLILPG